MTPITFSILFLFSIALFSVATAQERAPHGLDYENPVAFPPSAYDFFHPSGRKPENRDHCDATKCSPLPMAAQVEDTQIYENKAAKSQNGRKQMGAGGVAGIIFGVAFVVLLAMGVYYVKVTRRANMNRTIVVQSNA